MSHFTIFNVDLLKIEDNSSENNFSEENIIDGVILNDEIILKIVEWYQNLILDLPNIIGVDVKNIKVKSFNKKIKITFDSNNLNDFKDYIDSFINPDDDGNYPLELNGMKYLVIGNEQDALNNLNNEGDLFDMKAEEKHINYTNHIEFYEKLKFTKILRINYYIPENLWEIVPQTLERVEIINLTKPIEIPDWVKDVQICVDISLVKLPINLHYLEYIFQTDIDFEKGFLPEVLEVLKLSFVNIKTLVLPKNLKELYLESFSSEFDFTNLPNLEKLVINSDKQVNIDFLPSTLKELEIYDEYRENGNYNFANLPPSLKKLTYEGVLFDEQSIPSHLQFIKKN